MAILITASMTKGMNHFLMTDNLKLADAEIQNHAMCISN
jgi:hypothetical protein